MPNLTTERVIRILNCFSTIQRIVEAKELSSEDLVASKRLRLSEIFTELFANGNEQRAREISEIFESTVGALQSEIKIPISIVQLLSAEREHFKSTLATNVRVRRWRANRSGNGPALDMNSIDYFKPLSAQNRMTDEPIIREIKPPTEDEIIVQDGKRYLRCPDGSLIDILD